MNKRNLRDIVDTRNSPTAQRVANMFNELAQAGGDEDDARAFAKLLFGKQKSKRRGDNTPALPFVEGDVAAACAPSGIGPGKIIAFMPSEGAQRARRPSLRLGLMFCADRLELDRTFESRLLVRDLWAHFLAWLGPERQGLAGSPLVLPKALNAWAEPQLDQAARKRLRQAAGRESLRGLLAGRETRGVRRPRFYLGVKLRGG